MIAFFYRMTRRPSGGGRLRLFTQQQELSIVDLVRANNAIRLNKLQQHILADREVFNNIERVSISTIRRILVKHQITMKQLYRVPFERNSFRVKGLRREYVQVSVTVLYIYNTVLVSSVTAEYVPLYQYHIDTFREVPGTCSMGWGFCMCSTVVECFE